MNIKTSRTILLGAVSRVSRAVGSSASSPNLIFGCILVEGHVDGRVSLTGANGDVTLATAIECEVTDPCKAAIPAGLFNRLLSALPEGAVELAYDPAQLRVEVRCDIGRTRISCVDPSLAPKPAKDGKCIECSVPAIVLREILRKTSYAMSQDDTRKTLRNTLFRLTPDGITAAATNGRILSEVKYGREIGRGFESVEVLVPQATCNLLADRSVLGAEGDVAIRIPQDKRTHAVFSCGGTTLRTRLCDDIFPNYAAVIPPTSDTPATVERKRLMEAIERASIFSPSGEGGYVALTFDGNALKVESQKSESGDFHETIPVRYEGGRVRILLAKRYIEPILKATDDDEVLLHVISFKAPVLVTCSVPFIAVAMPVRDEGAENEEDASEGREAANS